jgi:hypothetical protein
MSEEAGVGCGLVVGVSFLLFAVPATLGYRHVQALPDANFLTTLVVLAIPLTATLIFLAVSSAAQGLYATKALRFPLTVTLPAVHTVLLYTSAKLWSVASTGSYLVRPPQQILPIAYWVETGTLLTVLVLQIVCLSLVAAAWSLFRRAKSKSD